MNSAKLIVDGIEADYYKSEELSPRITRQVFDLTQLDGGRGDFSLNLTLPNTAHNDRLFGWPGDVQAKQPFYAQARRKASIEVDGQVVLSGSLSIDSRVPQGYAATILGSSVAWAEAIADKTLRELKTFPALLFTGIRSAAFHAWPDHDPAAVGLKDIWPTAEGGGYEMQFPLIGYGNFDSDPTDDVTLNPINGQELVAGSAGSVDGALIYNDSARWPMDQFAFRGGAFVRDIMRRIFAEAGYRVGGTWYDDPNNVNLFVPYTDSSGAEPQWNWATLGQFRAAHFAAVAAYFDPVDNQPSTIPGNPTGWAIEPLWAGFNAVVENTGSLTGTFPSDFHVVTRNTTRRFSYYRAEFTDVRKDYAFGSLKDRWVAMADQVATVRASFTVDSFRHFQQSAIGEDVSAFLGYEATDVTRRCLLMLVLNPPELPTDWAAIDTGHLISGAAVDNPQVLASVDLSALSNTQTQYTVNGSHRGVEYHFGNAAMEFNIPDLKLAKGDKVVVVIAVQAAHTVEHQVDYIDGDQVSEQDNTNLYTSQSLTLRDFSLEVSNVRKPDGTRYETHLTAAALLPDMGQKDFVKSFIAEHNLFVAAAGTEKLVTLNYPDTYLLPADAARNWTALADLASATVEPACKFKRFVFDFRHQDGEALLDWQKFRLVVNNDDRMATEEFSVQLAFAPTAPRRYTWVQHTRNVFDLPCLNTREELAKLLGDLGTGQQQTKVDYAPRLLRWEGFKPYAAFSNFQSSPPFAVGGFNADGILAYPMNESASPNFVPGDFWLPTATVLPLLTWGGVGGLYDRHYAASVRALLKAVKVTLMAMLQPGDLDTLDQRRPVAIDGILFSVNLIQDFNPVTSQPTRAVLIRRY